jgi:cell division transport system permease protein
MEATTADLKAIPEIVNIRGRLDVSQNLIRLKNIMTLVMTWLFIVLVVISIFIISNTIRVAMFARRKEINIMKHVGATDWFIRWPFVVEGILIGGFSGLVAFGLQVAIYTYIADKVLSGIELIRLMPVSAFFPHLLIGFLSVGILIGTVSSTFSVRKHLNA